MHLLDCPTSKSYKHQCPELLLDEGCLDEGVVLSKTCPDPSRIGSGVDGGGPLGTKTIGLPDGGGGPFGMAVCSCPGPSRIGKGGSGPLGTKTIGRPDGGGGPFGMTVCCCLNVVSGGGPPRVQLLYDTTVWVPTLRRIFAAGLLAGLPANFRTFFKMPGLVRPDGAALSMLGPNDHANKSGNERTNCHTRQLD